MAATNSITRGLWRPARALGGLYLLLSAAGLLSACGSDASGEMSAALLVDGPHPNIVVMIADDLGYGDLGCYGSQGIATPRLDQMAAQGMRFESFYTHAVCTPTRAALMTGRYALRVRMGGALGPWAETGLNPSEYTVAEALRSAGYRTGLFGKWHLGDAPEQLPTAQGFDEFAGLPWGPTGIPTVEFDSVSGVTIFEPDPVTQTERATDRTIDFIERAALANDRFFCIASYVSPHKPAVASPAFLGTSVDGRDYGDAVQELDFHVGRILDRLDALGLGQDTLVLFLSDNGAGTGGDPYQNGSNGVLRGSKGTSLEGGIRVPAIVRWTGEIASGQDEVVAAAVTDLLPTFASLAGVTLPAGIIRDGVDISSLLRLGVDDHPNRAIHSASGQEFQAVRRGRYKYRLGELYDVVADPGESTDLAGAMPSLAAGLAADLSALAADVQVNGSAPGISSRANLRWRGGQRHSAAPVDGDSWRSLGLLNVPLILEDSDAASDIAITSTAGLGPPGVPAEAMTLSGGSEHIRWTWRSSTIDSLGPFTVGLWYRAAGPNPALDTALLDIGDAAAGLSMTIGDAGILGDDAAQGRRDDVLVRIGGSASPTSGAVAFDLPDDASTRFHQILVRRDAAGDLACFLDGFEVGRVTVPGADFGAAGVWSLLSPDGEIGGSAGPGVLPFDTALFEGALAGLQVSDRAMPLNEVQSVYCRYLHVPYCYGAPHSSGRSARLRLSGSFVPLDDRLFFEVTSAPPQTFGLAVVAGAQGRIPLGTSSLCFTGTPLRFNGQLLLTDPSGAGSLRLPFSAGPQGFDPFNGEDWNFQFWLRDGGSSTTTNAVRVRFCR